jgi:hypothetical protein
MQFRFGFILPMPWRALSEPNLYSNGNVKGDQLHQEPHKKAGLRLDVAPPQLVPFF